MKIKIDTVNVYITKAPLGEEQGSPIPVKIVPEMDVVKCHLKLSEKGRQRAELRRAERARNDGVEPQE